MEISRTQRGARSLIYQGIELKPKTILSDFELSIIQAAQLTFPMAALRGCYFHFCQCLIRKVQCLGLQTNKRENRH